MERLDVSADSAYRPAELAIHLARYLPVRDLVRGARVLDLACGEGYASYGMRRFWGAREVVGVDCDAGAVSRASRRFAHPGLSFVEADAAAYAGRLRGGFDLAISVETIEHVPDPAALLAGLGRAVGAQGAIFVTCPNDPWYYGAGPSLNPHHLASYDLAAFRELAEAALGPAARWMLGTSAAGFATYALPLPLPPAPDADGPGGAGAPGADPWAAALETAFEHNAPDTHSYLDLESGQVITIVDARPEDDEKRRLIRRGVRRFIHLDPASSREQYRWMERFVASVTDETLKERLVLAIDGKGAFRRFKDVLLSYPVERDRWFAYRATLLHIYINNWMTAHDIALGEAPPWGEPEEPPEPDVPLEKPIGERGEGPTETLRRKARELLDTMPALELPAAIAYLRFLHERMPSTQDSEG